MKCYVNVATSPKHPCWCLLGEVQPSPMSSLAMPPGLNVAVASGVEPRLIELLRRCETARLPVYVKLEASSPDTRPQRFMSVTMQETAAAGLQVQLFLPGGNEFKDAQTS